MITVKKPTKKELEKTMQKLDNGRVKIFFDRIKKEMIKKEKKSS